MTFLHPVRWEAALHASAGPMERGKVPSFQRAPWCAKCSPLGVIVMRKLFSGPCGPVLPPGSGSIGQCRAWVIGAPVACCDLANSLSPGKGALLAWARPRALNAVHTYRMREILTLPETCPRPPA